jgi:thiosulfate dehydrogenase (quinone) large subunit
MTAVLTRDERRAAPPRRVLDVVTSRPALALLPLRAFLGFTFAYAGLQKLADPSFLDASNPRSIQGQLALVRDASPLRFVLGVVADHAVLFGVAIALAELAVGLATLLGLWQRLAALVGGLVALSFFLTISWRTTPYYYGPDIGFFFAWTPLMVVGAPVLSLDAWRLGRAQLGEPSGGDARPVATNPEGLRPAPPTGRGAAGRGQQRGTGPDPGRRALLATGGVGAAFAVAAGLDAGIGRARHRDATATATPSPTPPASSPPAGHSSAGPSKRARAAEGTRIAAVTDVPVGSAKTFTDPASGAPAYVLQPAKGEFRAFSAVCTHAGCTVAFVKGSQQFQCPCHGGVYDAKTGKVLAGPPPQPLRAIEVRQSSGQLIVPRGG